MKIQSTLLFLSQHLVGSIFQLYTHTTSSLVLFLKEVTNCLQCPMFLSHVLNTMLVGHIPASLRHKLCVKSYTLCLLLTVVQLKSVGSYIFHMCTCNTTRWTLPFSLYYVLLVTPTLELTEEQKKRIESNKEKAKVLRKERICANLTIDLLPQTAFTKKVPSHSRDSA